MFGKQPVKTPQHVAFLLLPNFSMMAFASSVEPLRAANRQGGRELYSWQTFSVDGGPVTASNGVVTVPHGSVRDELHADVLFVCAGIRASQFRDDRTLSRLHELGRSGMAMGGICSGSLALAQAGLLKGYRCTIHWEYVEPFVENFPELEITATLFEIDRDRYTCSGGTAPLDMMINSIALDHGEDLGISVAEQMLHTFIRHPHDAQRMPMQHRTGISHPKLLGAIAHMEAYLEHPMSLKELAASVDLSNRQLERLFRDHLHKTPSRYYLELRLRRARMLLRQTEMPVLQIAVASGFSSASHFARCFREFFTHSPRQERNHIERIPGAGGNGAEQEQRR
ncbi:MAG TPA: GlxA family transcriptional regulator [Woeseiaceae bacterium]|nr:GlxA family transcriptional regulator [Woeseiaceae bacterium]